MVKRNPHFSNLSANYLFPEVAKRVRAFLAEKPEAFLISLSVGDTSEPIPKEIAQELKKASLDLAIRKRYRGYGAEQGDKDLRAAISEAIYHRRVQSEEVFISDGAKCDIGRLQILFGNEISIAVQDPSYPVYVDTSVILGQKKIHFLPCLPQNDFLPDLNQLPRTDLIYFCSPNNPTGACATLPYLTSLVEIARKNKSIVIYDAAYSAYIEDKNIPRSIYEVPGAKEVAIEVSSFSKLIGFTGVRLGWTIVPEELKYEDGKSVRNDWSRIVTTFFNGASNIAQRGGFATLKKGLQSAKKMVAYYKENSLLLRNVLNSKGLTVHGGVHAPYLWVEFVGKKSWDIFQLLLEELHLITTPGSGFGKGGEGFLRLSAFGNRKNILKAMDRIEKKWPKSLL